jgi:hypothetical protein
MRTRDTLSYKRVKCLLYKAYEGQFTRNSNCTSNATHWDKNRLAFSGLNVWKHQEMDVSAPRMTRPHLGGIKIFTLELIMIHFVCNISCRQLNHYLSFEWACCLFRQDVRSPKKWLKLFKIQLGVVWNCLYIQHSSLNEGTWVCAAWGFHWRCTEHHFVSSDAGRHIGIIW